jgi:DMSO/TMAO reductase YedYZ molybdopterin-dependent catalytic subunit
MGFFFTTAHYWTAWLAIGAIILHVAVQLPVIRQSLTAAPARPAPETNGLSRRGLLTTVAVSAGVITIATAGETIPALGALSVLGPRQPDLGPQGLPVNVSAQAAQVSNAATDPAYRLRLSGPSGTRLLTLTELQALPQRTVSLPIVCVEGWSANGVWTGVTIADLIRLAGATDTEVLVESLQKDSQYASSVLAPPHARDPLTLLALRLHGQPLALDHGYPARLIAPNRPGVMQTKWVAALTVLPR